jgi:hypothetical protein
MKQKQTGLKLYVKPENGKTFGNLDFVWVTNDEIPEYTKKGYVRVKKLHKLFTMETPCNT